MSKTLDFDPDALREKYRPERDRRLRAEAMTSTSRSSPTSPLYRRSAVEPLHRAPLTDEVDVVIIGGGFGGPVTAARLAGRASRTSASSSRAATSAAPGTGTATPARSATSSRTSTCRCSKRPATSRRRNTATRRRSSSTARRIGEHFDLYRRGLLPDRGDRAALVTRRRRWIVTHQPRRRDARAVRRDRATGPLNRPKLPGIPGIETFRATGSTPAAGTTATPAATTERGLTKLADKRVADHRHRRHRDPVRPAPRRSTRSTSTCSSARRPRSTCAATSRPTRVGEDAEARLAAHGWRTSTPW